MFVIIFIEERMIYQQVINEIVSVDEWLSVFFLPGPFRCQDGLPADRQLVSMVSCREVGVGLRQSKLLESEHWRPTQTYESISTAGFCPVETTGSPGIFLPLVIQSSPGWDRNH